MSDTYPDLDGNQLITLLGYAAKRPLGPHEIQSLYGAILTPNEALTVMDEMHVANMNGVSSLLLSDAQYTALVAKLAKLSGRTVKEAQDHVCAWRKW